MTPSLSAPSRTRPHPLALLVALIMGLVHAAMPSTGHAVSPTLLPPIPLTSVTAPGSVTGTGPNGEPAVYWMSSGNPATFAGTDARTGKQLVSIPVPTASGSWALTRHPNGDIYIGSYGEGRLFRYTPGADAVEDLGPMVPTETFIWSTTKDENGVIYGGTGQVGGHVFSYDPATGAVRDYGAWGTTDTPIIQRGLAAGKGRIWVGSGPVPRLTEIDVKTGARTDIPLPPTGGETYLMDLDLRGDLLFARVSTSGSPSPLHVYDLTTRTWIDSIDKAQGLRMSEVSPDGRYTYFTRDNTLHRYDLQKRTWEATSFTGVTDVRGFGWLDLQDPAWPGLTLVGSDYRGGLWRWNPTTGKGDRISSDVPGAPATLRSAAEGPDGKLYFSSYLGGGLASYDPVTNQTEFIHRIGQAEGMTAHDGAVYAGTYPRGQLWQYRPDQPTVAGQNPKVILDLYDQGQSRPWALVSAGRHLAMGTVPHNGAMGGLLALVDPKTGEHWTEKVAGGQSVVGLVYRDGILYGATSAFGGSGATRPTKMNAHVFAYDVEKRTMLWTVNPQAGEGALGQLAFDKQGNLWTGGPATVHKLDPRTGKVLASRTYASFPWDVVEYVWVGAHLWTDPYTDKLMVTTQGATYEVDPVTLERARVFQPVTVALPTNSGENYAMRDVRVWRWSSGTPVAASLSVDPLVRRGDATTIKVTGLGPNEPVSLRLRPSAEVVANVVADSTGTVTHEYTVPVGAAPGEQAVEVERPLTRGILRATWTVQAPLPTYPASGVFGDQDGDRIADVYVVNAEGVLELWKGSASAVTFLGNRGTNLSTATSINKIGDWNGDGRSDVLVRRADNSLWVYTANASGELVAWKQVGRNWGAMDAIVFAGSLDGTGVKYVVARHSVTKQLYRYTMTREGLTDGIILGHNWGGMSTIFSVGDFDGDGRSDIVSIRSSDGSLWLYRGTKGARLASGVQVGKHWNGFRTAFSPGDLNGDGRFDLIGVDGAGVMWGYQNLGNGKWGPYAQLSSGFATDRLFA